MLCRHIHVIHSLRLNININFILYIVCNQYVIYATMHFYDYATMELLYPIFKYNIHRKYTDIK